MAVDPSKPKSKFKWRKWNNILHRDIGYLCVGLTIIYAISGVAVNHIDEWNPSYINTKHSFQIGQVSSNGEVGDKDIKAILSKIDESTDYKSTFFEDEDNLVIFKEKNTIKVQLSTGIVNQEKIEPRFFFREVNFLHLNHAKQWWTWMADLYAVALLTLALTGMFVLKGKKGITGRGAWLTALGILIPILFLIIYL